MSPRRPATFRLDDPAVAVAPVGVEPEHTPQERAIATAQDILPSAPKRRRLRWGTLFWSALGALVSLGAGLSIARLIEDLYARAPWLGTIGAVLAALMGLALIVIVAREAIALARLRTMEKIRQRAEQAMATDDRDIGRGVVSDLLAIARPDPTLARSRADLESHLGEIIDGRDLVLLVERHLMRPLDAEARRRVSAAAKRVSVVTAVSPRAAVDLAIVLYTAVTLVRGLADLYGTRPGALGLIRLFRHTLAHLAVTGGMAAGDSLVQQVLGHGVAARLSARLGEGVLNGLLTARLGLAAIDVIRPLPFIGQPRPTVTDLAGDLVRKGTIFAERDAKDG